MLRSTEPLARAAATRVLCYWRDRVADPLALLKVQVADEHPAVRLEAVRAASFFTTNQAAEIALASLQMPQDRFIDYTLDQAMRTLQPFNDHAESRSAFALTGRACLARMPTSAQTRILIDQPLIAVEYQLARLSNDDLARLERKPDDPRYRPVYMAILTRKGLTKAWRDEAIARAGEAGQDRRARRADAGARARAGRR